MKRKLSITLSAERDMRQNEQWWSEHRSVEQADRWLIEIDKLIYSLIEQADSFGPAMEEELRQMGIKQAPFGLGRRPTHRIVYGIEDDTVVIYRVRAFSQDAMMPGDLES